MTELSRTHISLALWLCCLHILDMTRGQTAGAIVDLVVNNSNPVPYTDVNPDREAVCSNQTKNAEELWCYQCEQSYSKVYEPANAVCLHNLSQVALRRCGPRDHYCKVERMDLHRNVMTIERGCVEDCYYGCRFNGYGLTQMRCTSCCRTPCCNDDNSAPAGQIPNLLYVLLSGILTAWTFQM